MSNRTTGVAGVAGVAAAVIVAFGCGAAAQPDDLSIGRTAVAGVTVAHTPGAADCQPGAPGSGSQGGDGGDSTGGSAGNGVGNRGVAAPG
ncbi:hypothetical protein [Rhodococcus tibetensis]|uniref:Lipoprotein n=1 Tax=Rhodococcus tibetensis TaxID=2965064 RepID=A0ABT1QKE1_9NOCA|nr:hypothetical protein [Rhodococcus sp. FXJ9.536]MCQ4122764.1 hypothetical protein [Rhodococcus sp. FXJ9.536]